MLMPTAPQPVLVPSRRAPAVGSAWSTPGLCALTPPEIAHFLSKLRARIGFKRLLGARVGLSTSELQQLRGDRPLREAETYHGLIADAP
jgi:hypothetical protein